MACFSSAFIARKRRLARIVALAVVALAAGALSNSATAADVTWTGAGDMTWTQPDATSWSAPYASGDNVLFTTNGTSGFSNNLGGGSFTVSLGGVNNNQSIMLNFIPVPEPSTLALLAAARRSR